MSMFGDQNGRDYFIFNDNSNRKWFTDKCNDPNRNNMAWKYDKANEEVRINPKYILKEIFQERDVEHDELTDFEQNHCQFIEGAKKQIVVNAYERNRNARMECIKYYGCQCSVCGIVLENIYGDLAKDYIHVHHVFPISEISEIYTVDPIKDLRPICPNCHSIIHRYKDSIGIEELKEIIHLVSNEKNNT